MTKYRVLAYMSIMLLAGWTTSCKQKNKGSNQLASYIPAKNNGVVMFQKLGNIPRKLDALLLTYEGKSGQFRDFISGLRNRIGIDPLNVKSLETNGINPNGTLLASRLRLNGRKTGIAALSISAPSAFEKWLKDNLRNKLLAKRFVTSKQGPNKQTVTSVYSVNSQKQLVELMAYTMFSKVALVSWGFSPSKASAQGTTDNAKALDAMMRLAPKQRLQTDKAFHKALSKMGKSSQMLMYIPQQADKTKLTKKQAAQLNQQLRRLRRRSSLLGRLPIGQLRTILEKNPAKGGTASLSISGNSIKLRGMMPIPKVALAPIKTAIPQSGSSKTLLNALHKDAILTVKAGVEPTLLPLFIKQMAQGMKRKPAQIEALLKQYTGLVIGKDIIPAGTGHVYLTLYNVNLKPLQRVINGNFFAISRMLDIALVAQAKDEKVLQATLNKMAASMKIMGNTVTKSKGPNGQIRYSIPAWPGTVAYWTLYKKTFIYSVGEASLTRTIRALDNPKERLFANSSQAGPLAKNDTSSLYINVNNIRGIIRQLPFGQRMAVGLILSTYNVDKLNQLTLSATPGEEEIDLSAILRLNGQ